MRAQTSLARWPFQPCLHIVGCPDQDEFDGWKPTPPTVKEQGKSQHHWQNSHANSSKAYAYQLHA